MKVTIIAEAGVNHNGNMDMAMELVEKAAKSGADYIKFQTFITEKAVSRDTPLADYQKKNSSADIKSLYELVKTMELTRNDHILLMDHCQKNKISFLSSPFDLDSIKMLDELGLDTLKIPSGEITNLPYLRTIGRLNKKIIMSTGMAEIDEIKTALDILTRNGTAKDQITILHCNTEYPSPFGDINLRAMLHLKEVFGLPVGYSDHTLGIEIPIAAVALGACVIEKHFTLDKNLPGPDHKASLVPEELNAMVSAIRNIEIALGDGIKKPSASEKKYIILARKSIFICKNISKGELIDETHLITMRPGDGISAMLWDVVIGKKAVKDLVAGHKLEASDFE
jgi:N,N'-diacetyllegionaminate synthase